MTYLHFSHATRVTGLPSNAEKPHFRLWSRARPYPGPHGTGLKPMEAAPHA
jgi:hypothetical protein